jgi:hypothetical protein
MLIMVITFNIALAVLCLGVARKLHQIKQSLKRATCWLTEAERNTHIILHSAPSSILLGQIGAQYGKKQLTGLSQLQQQFVRLAALLQLLQWITQAPLRPIPKRLSIGGKKR